MSLGRQLILNSLQSKNVLHSLPEIESWLEKRRQSVHVHIKKKPLNSLEKWNFENGSLIHESGGFFSIIGLNCQIKGDLFNTNWDQPIILQSEIGILGLLVKIFDGVPHFLIQAKIEPGNVNYIQLSPTLQATRSNYKSIHKGRSPHYVEYFLNQRGKVIYDQLQSEQGARFYRKRNRNMILLVDGDVPVYEDFCWMSLGQIFNLMKVDNMINMDTRAVLSGLAMSSLLDLEEIKGVLFWLTNLKSSHEWHQEVCSLEQLVNWKTDGDTISHIDNLYFEVIGAQVEIENREVSKWSQPLIATKQKGILALLARKGDFELEFLFQAKAECGLFDCFELAPTVQSLVYDDKKNDKIPFLNYVLESKPQQHLADVYQSEEGGRFFQEENRNMVIMLGDGEVIDIPPNFKWISHSTISSLINFNNYVNIQSRCLLTLVNSVL